MAETDDLDNNYEGSIDVEVTFMSRKFKQMKKKKEKFQHSSRHKGTRFKKKHEESNKIIRNLNI